MTLAGSIQPVEAALEEIVRSPLRFVEVAFGPHVPDHWQREALAYCESRVRARKPIRLAVRAGHGVGKGAFAAWLMLWHVLTRPDAAGIVTANTAAQLRTKTWRELNVWRNRLPVELRDQLGQHTTRLWHESAPTRWGIDAIAWSLHRPEAFAGLHARHVLVVYDEASAIPDQIWETTEGALTTPEAHWVVLGNPTRPIGRFAECWGRHAGRWHGMVVDAEKSRFASREQLEEWAHTYGRDSDFWRVRVSGEFPSLSSCQLIDRDTIVAARRRPIPDPLPTDRLILGVDVARFGDDRTVLAFRRGPDARSIPWRILVGHDTMQVAGAVLEAWRQYRPVIVAIDAVGIGAGVVDRLREQQLPGLVEVQLGGAARDERAANVRSELYLRLAEWLPGGAIPDRDDLARELLAVDVTYDSRGRLALPPKDRIRMRGLIGSPDLADALALTFATRSITVDAAWAGARALVRRV